MSRSARTTKKQKGFIINFLGENKLLLGGQINPDNLPKLNKLWEELTKAVNELGPSKTIKQWKESKKGDRKYFGILVAPFRVFHRLINAAPETVDNIVKATICLHNYIRSENNRLYLQDNDVDREVNGVLIPGQWRSEVPQVGTALQVLSGRLGARNASQLAAFTRDDLKRYVNTVGSCMAPWQWDYVNETN